MAEQSTEPVAPAPRTLEQHAREVSAAFQDAHAFTEFCFRKLEARMDRRFAQVDRRLDKMDGRLDKMDSRLGRQELLLTEILNEVKGLRSSYPIRNR